MSKDGLNKNHWIIIFLVGAVALWAAIEYLFWGTKPTPLGESLTAILVMYIWIRGRIDEQYERLEEMESRIDELESRQGSSW